MKALRPVFTLILAMGLSFAVSSTDITESFEWPEVQPGAIPDLRLSSKISEARQEALEARSRARDGERTAGQARRHDALKNSVGLGAKPVTIDAGTIMVADEFPSGNHGNLLGTITYPSGARMLGAFGPDTGTYTASPESPLKQFNGWVYGARTSAPIPMTGAFEFKSGEFFFGSYNTGGNALGIYLSADGSRRFVGEIDFHGASWRPTHGVLESKDGKVLAIVGAD